jgi:HPt (histidine-containing phosphotransfer) domain-containing protein
LLLLTVTQTLSSYNKSPTVNVQVAQSVAPKAVAAAAATSGRADRLISTLPVDDADFREIVVHFVNQLSERLQAIEQAFEARDLVAIAKLSHWLRGTGGSVGFAQFTEPSLLLEDLARRGDLTGMPGAIDQLRQIAARIMVD